MKIMFSNSELFIKPLDEKHSESEPLPDGYEIVVKLPPQGSDLLSVEEK